MRRRRTAQAIGSRRTSRLHAALRATLALCLLALAVAALAVAAVADAAAPATRDWLATHSASASREGRLPAAQLADARASLRRRLVAPLRSAPASTIGSSDASASGTIEGEVASSASGKPIAGIDVCAFPSEGEAFDPEEAPYECTSSDSAGDYSMSLPAGEYDVEFFVPLETELNYQPQFYKDVTQLALATPVQVTSGGDEKGIDAAMQPGGAIGGTVTSATTNAPLPGVLVCADARAELGSCAVSGAAGTFDIVGLANGDYEVEFIADPEGETTYVDQVYPGTVAVTVPETTPGIDVALRLTPPIARSRPSIDGTAVAGQTLTVTHASWSNQPTRFRDNWLRCATSESTICLVLATSESYALRSSDVGSVIRVKEWAYAAAGESEPVGSAATSVVLAAPTSSAAVAPVPPAPAPATGVLSTTSVKASTAQLRSLLARLLVPSGRNAKIANLLKHNGYSVSFDALSAGKLTISWFVVPKGAHIAAAKPVLAAVGSVSSPAPGAAKLTIRLTAKGKGLLAHAGRLDLTAKGLLQPSGAATLAATRSFTLSARG